jgi:methylated-DNA-[protein]-cysteine S-methyltransferase
MAAAGLLSKEQRKMFDATCSWMLQHGAFDPLNRQLAAAAPEPEDGRRKRGKRHMTGCLLTSDEARAARAAEEETPLLRRAADQVAAYFAGRLRAFDLPLEVRGSDFQQQVCARIAAIPWGQTSTYGAIATALDAAPQAVGRGCGGNPIPLFIPCHRVLGATGLGGFSGGAGVETKVWLLRHEGAAGLLI